MIQRAQELMDRLRQDFPTSFPELKTFPSGAFEGSVRLRFTEAELILRHARDKELV
jgi:hypothetical protein